jgi:hypothetical protein
MSINLESLEATHPPLPEIMGTKEFPTIPLKRLRGT